MKPRIMMFGMGEMGSALSSVLKKRGYAIDAWDRAPGRVERQKSLFEIVPRADILFLCVPSWCLPQAVKSIRPFMRPHTLVVGISKGLQKEKGETTHAFLTHELHVGQPIALFGGALLAEDIVRGMPGMGVVAGTHKAHRAAVLALFKNTNIRCMESSDVAGIAYASVLKNIYALGIGIAEGAGWGGNASASFAYTAFSEMEEAVRALGGKKDSVWGNAGILDLIATGFSSHSKNAEMGKLIAEGKRVPPASEGIVSLPQAMRLLKKAHAHLPLFEAIHKAVTLNRNPKEAFRAFLA